MSEKKKKDAFVGIDLVLSDQFAELAEHHIREHNENNPNDKLPDGTYDRVVKQFEDQLRKGVWPKAVEDAFNSITEELSVFAEGIVEAEAYG